jgi:K(+)-stimulated pyrophosphate-energized sodium pump
VNYQKKYVHTVLILDSVGNTTAATGKVLLLLQQLISLALFAAYVTFTGIDGINILKAPVLAMLLEGMIPVVFSALAILLVKLLWIWCMKCVVSLRKFRSYGRKPEYAKCVDDISIRAALRNDVAWNLTIGFLSQWYFWETGLWGQQSIDGRNAWRIYGWVTVWVWAVFQNNTGGAWDNAKRNL